MDIITQAESFLMTHPVQTMLLFSIVGLGAVALSKNKDTSLKVTSKDFEIEFRAEEPPRK